VSGPKEGQPRGNAGKGRRKGSLNKTTSLLKEAILSAAEAAGGGKPDGLVNYLQAQAEANPGPFLALLGKVLPLQFTGEDGGPVLFKTVYETEKPSPPAS
jgi:hypothetical protein